MMNMTLAMGLLHYHTILASYFLFPYLLIWFWEEKDVNVILKDVVERTSRKNYGFTDYRL